MEGQRKVEDGNHSGPCDVEVRVELMHSGRLAADSRADLLSTQTPERAPRSVQQEACNQQGDTDDEVDG